MTLLVWVEVPVKNIERAARFYEAVLDLPESEISDDGVRRTAILYGGSQDGKAGISLNQTKDFEPSDKGVYVYLNAGADLSEHLLRVEPAGGKIVTGKTSMGAAGFYASFLDTEGNLLGLYSPQ